MDWDEAALKSDLDLLEIAGNPFVARGLFSGESYAHLLCFSAHQFWSRTLLRCLYPPRPCPQSFGIFHDGTEIEIDPIKHSFSGYIFKIQANMDRRHRDSMAFFEICSGRFEKILSLNITD